MKSNATSAACLLLEVGCVWDWLAWSSVSDAKLSPSAAAKSNSSPVWVPWARELDPCFFPEACLRWPSGAMVTVHFLATMSWRYWNKALLMVFTLYDRLLSHLVIRKIDISVRWLITDIISSSADKYYDIFDWLLTFTRSGLQSHSWQHHCALSSQWRAHDARSRGRPLWWLVLCIHTLVRKASVGHWRTCWWTVIGWKESRQARGHWVVHAPMSCFMIHLIWIYRQCHHFTILIDLHSFIIWII